MASLRFKYSPMNAGKSSNLLQVAHNYMERGMNSLVLKPSIDTKGEDKVVGRGMKDTRKVDFLIAPDTNVYELIINYLKKKVKKITNSEILEKIARIESNPKKAQQLFDTINEYLIEQGIDINKENHFSNILSAVLVDEAQFLTEKQVKELSDVAVILDIPVICFGLKTDFRGELFEGSAALFKHANIYEELTTVCICGKKALYNARLVNGKYVKDGSQVAIDGEDEVTYISLCPEHYREFVHGRNVKAERIEIKKKMLKK